MTLKNVSISDAATLAKRTCATRIAVITVDGESYGITTWASTRRDCRDLAAWAESDETLNVVVAISAERPNDGVISVALEPNEVD